LVIEIGALFNIGLNSKIGHLKILLLVFKHVLCMYAPPQTPLLMLTKLHRLFMLPGRGYSFPISVLLDAFGVSNSLVAYTQVNFLAVKPLGYHHPWVVCKMTSAQIAFILCLPVLLYLKVKTSKHLH